MKYIVTLVLVATLIFATQTYAATIKVINEATVDLVFEFTGNQMLGPVKVQSKTLDTVKVTKGTTVNVTISNDLAVSSCTVIAIAAGKRATVGIPPVAGKDYILKAVQKNAGDDLVIDWSD